TTYLWPVICPAPPLCRRSLHATSPIARTRSASLITRTVPPPSPPLCSLCNTTSARRLVAAALTFRCRYPLISSACSPPPLAPPLAAPAHRRAPAACQQRPRRPHTTHPPHLFTAPPSAAPSPPLASTPAAGSAALP
ncbi:hypothetical protein U1Q18_006736, partial [Sarracenia purpurea var. burkii]